MKTGLLVTAVLLAVSSAHVAYGAPLGPTKPSVLVSVRSDGSSTGCNSNDAVALDTNAATSLPLAIPTGNVLVVTDLFFASPGGSVSLPGVSLNQGLNSFDVGNISTDSTAGTQSGSLHLSSPLVVKAGQILCVGEAPLPSGFVARANGYFTKDK